MSDENVRNTRADIEREATRLSNISEELLQNHVLSRTEYFDVDDVDWTMPEGDGDASSITARPRHPSGVDDAAELLHNRLRGVRVSTQQTLQELEAHMHAQIEPHIEGTIRGQGPFSGWVHHGFSGEEKSGTVSDELKAKVFSKRPQSKEELPTTTLSFEGALLHLTLKTLYPRRLAFREKNVQYDQEEFKAFTNKLCEHAIDKEFFHVWDIERFIENMYDTPEMHLFSDIIRDIIIDLTEKMGERSPDFHDNRFLFDSNLLENHHNYHKLLEQEKDVSDFRVDQAIVVFTLSGHVILPVFTKKLFQPQENQKSKIINGFSEGLDEANRIGIYTMDTEGRFNYTAINVSHISSFMLVPVDVALKYLNIRHQPKPLPSSPL